MDENEDDDDQQDYGTQQDGEGGSSDEVDEEEYLDKINSDPKRVIEPKNGEKKEDDSMLNYKGIHFNDKPGSKFICPTTGSHFRVEDLCIKL